MKNRIKALAEKVDGEWGTREAVDIFDGKLYYKVVISSRERCNFGNMQ